MTRFNDRICAVCAAPAVGFGYSPSPKHPVAWVCSVECLQPAKESYNMPAQEFDRLSELATQEGGSAAGAYLETLGRFSLETLSEAEWAEFCRRLVGGYREALTGKLREEAPF